jgi:glycosyltransferase involved in cell wall biosynthesis
MITFFGIIHQSGGCGAELLGAIHLLRRQGVRVRCIVPHDDPVARSANADWLRRLGVTVVNYRAGMFERCPVLVTFGEDVCFDYIREYDDRPQRLVWTSGMSHPVDCEVEAWRDGLIDEFFFQTSDTGSDVAQEICNRALKPGLRYRESYRPFLDPDCEWMPLAAQGSQRTPEYFTVGRATRDDTAKWHPDSWRMFGGILVPSTKSLQADIAGWGQNAADILGNPCDPSSKWHGWMNINLRPHIFDPVEMAEFFGGLHVLLHYYPIKESWGYATAQAMLAGAVPIGADAGGFRHLVRHGETGFLVNSPEEASFYASTLAFDDSKWAAMSQAARAWIRHEGPGNPELCWPWWRDLLDLCKIKT